jgi:urease gamma subunit
MARYDQAFYDSGARYDEETVHPVASTMRNLQYYVENPFDSADISLDELIAFTTDHLQRMIANNPGALWNARITATTTAFTALDAVQSDNQTKLGLRKARKMAKDALRRSLPEKVAMIHAAVVAKYGPNGPEVAECFPQGRSIFTTCTDDHVQTHLQTMLNGVTAHQADLGAQVVSDASGLLSTWITIHAASESSTGAKASTQEARRLARENLQLELFKNLLTLAMNYPRETDKVGVYMQQYLLEDHPAAPEPPTPPAPGP